MTLPKGRVVKGPARTATDVPVAHPAAGRASRLLKASVAAAALEASAKIASAEAESHAILAAAEEKARTLGEQAREEGRRDGAAELVSAWVKLRTEQDARDERDLDRTIELARIMAERLVGETLALDAAKIQSVARQVLASARRSRRVVISANPEDAKALQNDLGSLGLEEAAIEIHADPNRGRGSLLLETDLGTIDANLTLQLDRLARSLRDSFRS